MTKHILVVEDEPALQELLRLNLSMAGYMVSLAMNAEEAMRQLGREKVHLCLVDWNMPGRSGVSLVRQMRGNPTLKSIPVIMVTARDEELDMVLAFEAGVDDYVTKPFRPRELLARVQSMLRRASGEYESDVIEIDGLKVDHVNKRVTVRRGELQLSVVEFKLLLQFVRRPMSIFSRTQLLTQVWGSSDQVQERTVDAHVARLRKQLTSAGHYDCIETVRALGYRFVRQAVTVELADSSALTMRQHG